MPYNKDGIHNSMVLVAAKRLFKAYVYGRSGCLASWDALTCDQQKYWIAAILDCLDKESIDRAK